VKSASLRYLLLSRLLPAMLLLLVAGAATAYWTAWRSATKAYDRALFDAVLAIADQLQIVDGKPQLPLTPQARAVLLTDKFDEMFYAVRRADGALLDGDARLLVPPRGSPRRSSDAERFYFDGHIEAEPVRVSALETEHGGQRVTILAAETLVKRNALVQEILLGMLVPELALSFVSLIVVWVGIGAGLRPLQTLREELSGRSPTDLRPVRVGVPEEIQPVVTEINALLDRLAHSLTAQRNFVADAAHQLRTPVAALQAQVEAALGAPREEHGQAMQGILRATQRLSHLITQMLALARAEPAAGDVPEHLSLPDLIRHSAESYLPRAFERQIDLGFELTPAEVAGNPLLLQELLANLLDNALRHTPEGGTITVHCGQVDGEAQLCVEDSGPGIREEDRTRVFERFFRAAGSPNDGTGLGLAIVREIARQHGGHVEAGRSTSLGGACLSVRLPASRRHDPANVQAS